MRIQDSKDLACKRSDQNVGVFPASPITENETILEILAWLDAPYRVDNEGRVLVDSDNLGLPATYGLGTEIILDDEAMDWSEWSFIWSEAECETLAEVLS